MKRIIYLLALIGLLWSCKPEEKKLDITGEWRLSDMTLTKAMQIGDQTVDVYMAFKADNTFDMWQFIGAGRYQKYSGTWSLTDDMLTGKYSDGVQWGNIYKVSLEKDLLTMEATEESNDIYVYARTAIPSGGPGRL